MEGRAVAALTGAWLASGCSDDVAVIGVSDPDANSASDIAIGQLDAADVPSIAYDALFPDLADGAGLDLAFDAACPDDNLRGTRPQV